MAKPETIGTPNKIALRVQFDTVHVELICGDEYAAQVLYDDMLDRLKAGEGLTISLAQDNTQQEKR